MMIEDFRAFMGWCSVFNAGVLVLWSLTIVLARGPIHRVHRSMFKLSEERFDEIHYHLIGIYKMSILALNVVPYLALRVIAG